MGFYIVVNVVQENDDDIGKIGRYLSDSLSAYVATRYYREGALEEFNFYKTDYPNIHVYEWPDVIHENSYFASKFCPSPDETIKLGFEIQYEINVAEHLTMPQVEPIPILACFMNQVKHMFSNMNPIMDGSSAYMYCIPMIANYCYIRSQGIKIRDQDETLLFTTLASISHNEAVYDQVREFIMSLTSENDPCLDKFDSKACGHIEYLKCESLIASYDDTGTVFKMFKGMFLARLMSKITSLKGNNEIKGQIFAHLLRDKYMTFKESNQWRYANYNGSWNISSSMSGLINAMMAIGTQLSAYIDDDILTIVGLSKDDYDKAIHIMTTSSQIKTVQDATRIQLMVKERTISSKRYNKTIRFIDCVYDLNLKQVREPRPHDFDVHKVRYRYYAHKNPDIEEKLDNIMHTYFPNPEIAEYVYQIFGRALSGNVNDKAMWIFLGETNSGKSKFMELVKRAFGTYADVLSGEFLNTRSRGSDATPSINKIIGKLLGIVQEPRNGKIDVENIKELTGDSHVNFRMLFNEAETMQNTARYVVCANDVNLNTYDAALWARIHVVEFTTKFVSEEYYHRSQGTEEFKHYRIADPDIEKSFQEVAPALMYRFIDAYHRSENMPMHHPEIIRYYTQKFRNQHDVTAMFFSRFYVKADTGGIQVPFDEVYQYYKNWYATTHGDTKNYISEIKLCEAARSNGYIITNGHLINVVYATTRAITNVNSSSGTLVLPNMKFETLENID